MQVRIGTLRHVHVQVTAGVEVAVVLVCGLTHKSVQATTVVEIQLSEVAIDCTATVSVPVSAGAATWQLVAGT